jgi:hypothetical protein
MSRGYKLAEGLLETSSKKASSQSEARRRIELSTLAQRIRNELPALPHGSAERANAITSLRNIRYVLAQRDFMP